MEYTFPDGKGGMDTATLTVTVAADLLLNDEDAEGDTLTITAVKGYTREADGTYKEQTATVPVTAGTPTTTLGSNGGTFTIHDDGSWSFDPGKDFDKLHETSKEHDTVRDTFVTYTVSDGKGGTHTATLTVTVTGEDDVPVLTPHTGSSITEDKSADVDDNLVVKGTLSTPIGGDEGEDKFKVEEDISDSGTVGTLTIDADGDWTWTAKNSLKAIDELGDGDSLTDTFTVTNADGVTKTTVEVTIEGVDDPPVAVDDFGATDEDTVLTVKDGATGSIRSVMDDSGTVTSTMTINADLLLNDEDRDDTLTITAVNGDTASVDTAIDVTDGGKFTIHADGSWTFDPDGDFDDLAKDATRTTSVVYTVTGGTVTRTATLTVTVTGANSPPVALDDVGTTDEDTILTVKNGDKATDTIIITDDKGSTSTITGNADLLLNDSDPDDTTPLTNTLTITKVGSDKSSQVEANVGTAIDGSNGGTFTIHADGSWTFDPNGNKDNNFNDLDDGETRTTSVVYTVAEGSAQGSLTGTATLTVTVTGINDPPVAVNDAGATDQDTTLTVADNANLLLNDRDPEGATLTITEVSGYTAEDKDGNRQSQDVKAGVAIHGSTGGEFIIKADGSWSFDPGDDFDNLADGKTRTTFVTYTVAEADDTSQTATATLTVTVTGIDDKPVAVNDVGTTDENGVLTVADGDTSGTITTTIIVTDDKTGDTSTMTTTDTVAAADLLLNDDPVDDGDTLTITMVKGYTRDADGKYQEQKDAVAVIEEGTAATPSTDSPQTTTLGSKGGTFTIYADGSYTFDPGKDFDYLADGDTATTWVTYTTSDGGADGKTDTARLTVTVTGENDGPVAKDDSAATTENAKLTVEDGDTTTTMIVTNDKTGRDQHRRYRLPRPAAQ